MGDFTYRPADFGLLQILFRWRGTVFAEVFCTPSWWIFFLFHLTLWYQYNWGHLKRLRAETVEDSLIEVKWSFIGIITNLTIFFEVFYTNECYSCYMKLNNLVNMAFRTSHRFAIALKTYTRDVDPGIRRMIIRYERCCLILFFMEIRHGPITHGQFKLIVGSGLLKGQEADFLENFTSAQRAMIIWDWMDRLIMHAYESVSAERKNSTVLTSLVDKLEELQEAQKKVLDVVRMPVPFQYFHLLNMMISVNVILWAYAMASSESFLAPVCFFFASLIYIGMLELAKELSDPFGRDEVDFPLHIWVEKFLENQVILERQDFLGDNNNVIRLGREEPELIWDCKQIGHLIEIDPEQLTDPVQPGNAGRMELEMNPAWGQYQPVPQDPREASAM